MGTSGGVMVNKLDYQTFTSEFDSHWVSYLNKNRLVNYNKLWPNIKQDSNYYPECFVLFADIDVRLTAKSGGHNLLGE